MRAKARRGGDWVLPNADDLAALDGPRADHHRGLFLAPTEAIMIGMRFEVIALRAGLVCHGFNPLIREGVLHRT